MNWTAFLKEKFGDVIIEAKESKADGLFILDITVKYTNLDDIKTITEEINSQVDEKLFEPFHFVSIHSPGTKIDIAINDLDEYIGTDLLIKTHKNEYKTNEFKVKLLSVGDEEITCQWNQKGNIRKINLTKSNISSIQKYFKF
ncbi:ribosome maturation factor RimP [Mycoplasmopsis californica]|uniref:Ribosome maturation factor RimP n=1 Tax=Mycoplasmopsis californica TaxID=2113 RepID=A0A059XX46_9BACT|nr:hypothetical protein [Mycoplasmopsis californica]AIA29767.1 ribosome maturation factor RimP [Mycoplasmopsis californica]